MKTRKQWRSVLAAAAVVLMATAVPNVWAEEEEGEGGLVDTIVAEQCSDMHIDAEGCEVALAALGGLQRSGVSFKEATESEDGEAVEVEIADFYFNATVTMIQDGTDVEFVNGNAPGGNTHSVMSSDWGGTEPVLPVPGVDFGGGKAFKSQRLSPQTVFRLHVDTSTMNPAGFIRLGTEPGSDALIPYHCYIHGPNVMRGFLLVHNEGEE